MTLNITSDDLFYVAGGGCSPVIVNGLVPFLNEYLPKYGVDTTTRMKHFFGQAAEESASFRTLTEYASGREYEGRRDLGNVVAGDGVRFKGRGIFQLTGRSNYYHIGSLLGVDLIANPELAATPKIAVLTALEYWNGHRLSEVADSSLSFEDTVLAITRKINGGTNGFAVRLQNTIRAQHRFANVVNTPAPVAQTAPVVKVVAPVTPVVTAEPQPIPVTATDVQPTVDTYIKKFF